MATPTPRKFLVISAIGADRPGIVKELSKTLNDAGCNVEDSRMTVLGGEFALILLISGPWNAIAKLDASLPALQKRLELTIVSKATEPRERRDNTVPYVVDVISMDHPGIVQSVAEFFLTRNINIDDMNSWTYAAAHTGTPMFSLNMTVSVPAEQQIGRLRQEFTEFCDDLNLDATLEPSRN